MDPPVSPSYSPTLTISNTQVSQLTFNQSVDQVIYEIIFLNKNNIDFIFLYFQQIDHIDGPTSPDENYSQQFDVNDGPDFFNRFQTPSPLTHSTFAEHPTPLRKVKRRLF